ncbi:MAG: ABC transporter ATP-binding protein [Lautropia sp.]
MLIQPTSQPLLSARGVRKYFQGRWSPFGRSSPILAVDDVSLDVHPNETLGLVGESGSGKSTLGRALIQIDPPTAGRVVFDGTEITGLSDGALRPLRRQMQMIFQDPQSSLNPRMRVADIIAEPLVINRTVTGRAGIGRRIAELLDLVRLPASAAQRFPHEFSGGQRQRIGIARAIALNPKLIIADEAVSSLDVSIQAQIMNLLMDLQAELRFACVFIAHDLAVVRHIADRIAVMYLGRIVEMASSDRLFLDPRHLYTRSLLEAVPIPDPEVEASRVRSSSNFARQRFPSALTEVQPGHFVAANTPEASH